MKKQTYVFLVIGFTLLICLLGGIVRSKLAFAATESKIQEFLAQPVDQADTLLAKEFKNTKFTFDKDVHNWYRYMLYEVLTMMPKKYVDGLTSISIKNLNVKTRGLVSVTMSSVSMKLNPVQFPLETNFKCEIVEDCLKATNAFINREWIGVFVHEFGHAIDFGKDTNGSSGGGTTESFKRGSYSMNQNDPSVAHFYPICFKTAKMLSSKCNRDDFVSTYSKTIAYEDFAETMSVYILDGPNFKSRATAAKGKGNEALMKKYNFFKEHIFAGKEFYLSEKSTRNLFTTHATTNRNFAYKSLLYKSFLKSRGYNNDPFSSSKL